MYSRKNVVWQMIALLSFVIPVLGSTAEIKGRVFWDSNKDRVRQPYETLPPVSEKDAITIKLERLGSGGKPWLVFFNGESGRSREVDFGEDGECNGCYLFSVLPGTYIISSVKSDLWVQTTPVENLTVIEIKSSQEKKEVDFGFQPLIPSNIKPPQIRCGNRANFDIPSDIDPTIDPIPFTLPNFCSIKEWSTQDDSHLVTIDFGDGETTQYWMHPGEKDLPIEHTYSSYGTGSYTIKINVVDNHGNADGGSSREIQVNMTGVSPKVTLKYKDEIQDSIFIHSSNYLDVKGYSRDLDGKGTTKYKSSWELYYSDNEEKSIFSSTSILKGGGYASEDTIYLPNELTHFDYPPGLYKLILNVEEKVERKKGSANLIIDVQGDQEDSCNREKITIESQRSGSWDSVNTWNNVGKAEQEPPRIPSFRDWVLIKSEHEISASGSKVINGLCIEGALFTYSTQLSSRGRYNNLADFHATHIHNKGRIRSEGGNLYEYDGWNYLAPPTNIFFSAHTIINEGSIITGDVPVAEKWWWLRESSKGGSIALHADEKFVQKMRGVIRAGDGFRGGDVILMGNMQRSEIMGSIRISCGAPRTSRWEGEAGRISLNGRVIGVNITAGESVGSCSPRRIGIDPTDLIITKDTHIEAGNIDIFGGEGDWEIDLSDLSESALTAEEIITIAAGENSTLILPETSNTVFKVGQALEIFADNFELKGLPLSVQEAKEALKLITEVPKIIIEPSKILYYVDIFHPNDIVGEPGETLTVKMEVFNAGPMVDSYDISATNSANWEMSLPPFSITLASMAHSTIEFEIESPETYGAETTVTLTARSQSDPSVQAVVETYVHTKEEEIITPRNSNDDKADLTLVLDSSNGMSGRINSVAEILQTFLTNHSHKVTDPPLIELVTFKDEVTSRVVTQDIEAVIRQLYTLRLSDNADCSSVATEALASVIPHVNDQILLLTAAPPKQPDMTQVIAQAQQQQVKINVILAGTCGDDEEADKALYQQLAKQTGGHFHWLPKELTDREALEEAILAIILDEPNNQPPLAVTLFDFEVKAFSKYIDIEWQTATEIDNAGFCLWRAYENELGHYHIIAQFIPTQGESFSGTVYGYRDEAVKPGTMYYYGLESLSFGERANACNSENVNIDFVKQKHFLDVSSASISSSYVK